MFKFSFNDMFIEIIKNLNGILQMKMQGAMISSILHGGWDVTAQLEAQIT